MVVDGIRGSFSPEEADCPVRVFCAYSHRDEDLRRELESHLAVLRRAGLIEPWYDGCILPGTKWEDQILKHLSDSELILLLVSSDFLASDYCCDVEMRQALERHYAGDAWVIPIILRPVAWRLTELARLQVLPRSGRPIFAPDTDQASRDQAFVETCEGILAILLNRGQRTPRRTAAPSVRPGLFRPRSRKRVLDAAMPSRIPVGKATMLLVQVRTQDSLGLGYVVELETTFAMNKDDVVSKPIRVQFPVDANGSPRPMGLSVAIQSPDFEPPTQSKGIQVPLRGDSEPRVFLLTAKHRGSSLVNVEVYRDDGALISGCMLRTDAEEPESEICRLQHVTSLELAIAQAQDENTAEQPDPLSATGLFDQAFDVEREKKPSGPFAPALAASRPLSGASERPPYPSPATRAAPAVVSADVPDAAPEDDLVGPTRAEHAPVPGTKKWLIGGGAAAAVVMFLAVLIPFLVSGNHAKTAVPPPATVPTPATVQLAPPVKAPSSRPGLNSGEKQPKTDQAEDTRKEPRVTGKCDLTESEIPKTLDRAEHYLHAGQLEEAQAQYERVVGCPAAHERAQAALRLVKQSIAMQGSSAP